MANSSNFGDDQFVDKPRYLILRPDKARIWDIFSCLIIPYSKYNGLSFLDASDGEVTGPCSHLEKLYCFLCIILPYFAKPVEYIGYVIEFISNLLSHNDHFGLLRNLLSGNVVIPRRDSETFLSSVGNWNSVDRVGYNPQYSMEEIVDSASKETGVEFGSGTRDLMLLCVMASELAYENENVVRRIVEDSWQMHFVSFHNGWNDYLEKRSTQLFILCDRPKDANLILISFRGTETFNLDDWRTDFDFSWYEVTKSVFLHVGFLEALGLGNRKKMNFNTGIKLTKTKDTNVASNELARAIQMTKKSAYYQVKCELMRLLEKHKNAKFLVTGHSLGGALAIMLPTIMVVNDEIDIMNRLLGVYTFGQPRIGNNKLGEFMKDHLITPVVKYLRLVYSNDIAPRVPWDNFVFRYKHFGVCLYYDSCYTEHKVADVPNPNLLNPVAFILMYINAVWELIRSFTIGCMCGREYAEGFSQIMYRMTIGLVLPFISAHGFTDYINSVKLWGKKRVVRM